MHTMGTVLAASSVLLLVGFSFAHAFSGVALFTLVLGGFWILLLHSGRSRFWDCTLLVVVVISAVPLAWAGVWLPAVVAVSLALYGWDASHASRALPSPEPRDSDRRRFVLRYGGWSAVWLVTGTGLAGAGTLTRFQLPFPVALTLALVLVGLAAATFHVMRSLRSSDPAEGDGPPVKRSHHTATLPDDSAASGERPDT